MHEPKFTKKCYDCTNRFVCWTNREKLPEIKGLPQCDTCGTQMEKIGEPYEKSILSNKLLFIRAKCPEKRWYNSHSAGKYLQAKSGVWVRTLDLPL